MLEKILALLVGTSCFADDIYTPVQRKIRDFNTLHVNENNDFIFSVNKSEIEGIKDLEHLAKSQPYEEAWMYANNYWTEIGLSEGTPIFENGKVVKVNYELSEGTGIIDRSPLITANFPLTVYHIHPRISGISTYEQIKIDDVQSVVPSEPDFDLVLKMDAKFPSNSITWKIVSPLGVTEYGFKKGAVERILNGEKTHVNLPDILNEKTAYENIQEILSVCNNEFTFMKFIPYHELYREEVMKNISAK